ncbi:MAG: fibronectin-binding domain-containing protein [Deferribacteres bacterium]|nr:fibronectin-binding domain-containing protein [Deferribacteres bacterium]
MDYYTLNKQFNYIGDKLLHSQVLKAYYNSRGFSLGLRRAGEKFWLNFALNPELAVFFLGKEPLNRESLYFAVLFNNLLKNARLKGLNHIEGERLFVFEFEKRDFSGKPRGIKLVFEVIGKKVNLILVEGERIIDAARREEGAFEERAVLPGRTFFFPDSPRKEYLWSAERDRVIEAVAKEGVFALMRHFYPVPKFVVEEISARLGKEELSSPQELIDFWRVFLEVKEELFSSELYLYRKPFKVFPLRRSCLEGGEVMESNEAVRLYVELFEREKALSSLKSELLRTVRREQKKLKKVLGELLSQLEKAKGREKYKLWAEAILINLARIKDYSEHIEVPNPYNEDEVLKIPLKKGKKPSRVAEEYFERYAKLKRAEEFLLRRKQEVERELSFLQELEWQIESSTSLSELEEVREILEECGYIKSKTSSKKPKKRTPSYRAFRLKDVEIYVGKSARGNDYVTFKLASRDDLWFHVKGYPGAHVVVKAKRPLSHEELEKAAAVAAFFSKAGSSSSVEVDYTRVKFVKRAKNYKPGMVVYKNFSTLRVKPHIPEEVEHVEKG